MIERWERFRAGIPQAVTARRTVRIGALVLAMTMAAGVPGPARAADPDPRTLAAIAAQMMPDDPLTADDAEVLVQLERALGDAAQEAPRRTGGRRIIEGLVHHHAGVLLRWLLADDRRSALGYQRGALMDVLITSHDPRTRTFGSAALLARPSLGYCMRARPAVPPRTGQLAAVLRDLGVVEALRQEAARLMLSVGDPSEVARSQGEARARAENLATGRPNLVRRWLLDETDAGIFDTYRAAIVTSFLESTNRSLVLLATEVAARRPRLGADVPPALSTMARAPSSSARI